MCELILVLVLSAGGEIRITVPGVPAETVDLSTGGTRVGREGIEVWTITPVCPPSIRGGGAGEAG